MSNSETISKLPASGPTKNFWRRIAFFLAIIGPGIITSNVDNDAGGITTYSLAGAHYGLSLLWTLLPITIVLIIVQEMGARMGVVSGKGLSDLIRERFGARTAFFLMILLFFANLGNAAAEFAGVAASMEIFSISKFVSVPLVAIFVWWLAVKGNYKSVEKVFLWACLFYATYIISGFMGNPDWDTVGAALVTVKVENNLPFIAMMVGVVGTTIAPWMQFYLQAAVVDKGLRVESYKYARMDVVIGSIMVNVIAFFIIVICAVTLFKAGIKIETAKDAALALEPLAGKYCAILFAIGLFNASTFAASILPLSTAYTICEAFGWESGLDHKFTKAPQFYGIYSLMIIISASIILLPNAPLVSIMYYSQVINGMLLPVVLIYMLRLINDKKIMGEHVNSFWLNCVTWIATVVLIILSLFIVASSLVESLR